MLSESGKRFWWAEKKTTACVNGTATLEEIPPSPEGARLQEAHPFPESKLTGPEKNTAKESQISYSFHQETTKRHLWEGREKEFFHMPLTRVRSKESLGERALAFSKSASSESTYYLKRPGLNQWRKEGRLMVAP